MLDENTSKRLSLFVDEQMGSAEARQYLRLIETNLDAARALSRYYLIGEVLRSGRVPCRVDFAERVRECIDREPIVIGPTRKSPRMTRQHWLTGAMAASLAAAALLVWNSLQGFTPSVWMTQLDAALPLAQVQSDPQLQTYLMVHSETSHVAGNEALMPYMRVLSYGKEHR
jgi:negative regulator of sigma E activity